MREMEVVGIMICLRKRDDHTQEMGSCGQGVGGHFLEESGPRAPSEGREEFLEPVF